MNDKTETLAAILAELRAAPADAEWNGRDLADRIEAATNREREENGAIIRACMENANTGATWKRSDTSAVDEIVTKARSALAAPARNCDVGTAYGLHAAFVKHCDSCNPPGGCCHRMDPRGMLDTNCASILKCFARFVLANKDGDKK